MAFGQSYLIGRVCGFGAKKFALAMGATEEKANKFARHIRIRSSLLSATATGDPLGAAKTLADDVVIGAIKK